MAFMNQNRDNVHHLLRYRTVHPDLGNILTPTLFTYRFSENEAQSQADNVAMIDNVFRQAVSNSRSNSCWHTTSRSYISKSSCSYLS